MLALLSGILTWDKTAMAIVAITNVSLERTGNKITLKTEAPVTPPERIYAFANIEEAEAAAALAGKGTALWEHESDPANDRIIITVEGDISGLTGPGTFTKPRLASYAPDPAAPGTSWVVCFHSVESSTEPTCINVKGGDVSHAVQHALSSASAVGSVAGIPRERSVLIVEPGSNGKVMLSYSLEP